MKIVVRREACCFQDDQIGPLESEFCVDDGATFASFIDEVVASGFLQYSSTHNHLTGEADGRALVEVFAPAGTRSRPSEFKVDADARVADLLDGRGLFFRFRHV